jgi:DNA-binding transcriptional regulator YiaG
VSSSLSALSGPRVRIRDVPRVRSGSRGKFLLRADRADFRGPQAALALAKRRLPLRAAHGVVTRLYDRGLAVVELPAVEDARKVIRDLAGAGVTATPYGAPAKIDIKTIREAMGLSQDQFALEFGLEVSTLRNWEQGRSEPDTAARNFLVTVARNPEAVRAALSRTRANDDYAAKVLAMKGSVADDVDL